LRAGPQAPLPEPSPVAIAVATPQASAPVAAEEPERDVIATEDEDDELAGLEAVAWGEPDDLWGGVGVEVDAESDELLAALDSWMEEDG
ncbi:MAG TPA: hypothetical protein PKA88_24315, partial [Polyangiaceae bacterium]|nr:hypothetical protein [Polyangiaceae bacterium]